jgi:hypothetical protein
VTQVVQSPCARRRRLRWLRRRLHRVCHAHSRGVTSITTRESSSLFKDKQVTTELIIISFTDFSHFSYWRISRLALPHPQPPQRTDYTLVILVFTKIFFSANQ